MTRPVQIRRFTAFRNPAGTILGFFSVELPSGLVVNDCKLMVGPKGGRWVAMPAVKQLDRVGNARLDANGKAQWLPIVEFADSASRERFRDLILDALRLAHPELFGDTPAQREPAEPPRQHRRRPPPYRQKYLRSAGETATLVNDPVDDLWQDGAP